MGIRDLFDRKYRVRRQLQEARICKACTRTYGLIEYGDETGLLENIVAFLNNHPFASIATIEHAIRRCWELGKKTGEVYVVEPLNPALDIHLLRHCPQCYGPELEKTLWEMKKAFEKEFPGRDGE